MNAIAWKNERALLGQRSKAAHFSRVLPHTLPKRARSVRASKRPKLFEQQASPMLEKEDPRIIERSLRWIRQHCCLIFIICVKGLSSAVLLLETLPLGSFLFMRSSFLTNAYPVRWVQIATREKMSAWNLIPRAKGDKTFTDTKPVVIN
jgi:hypothetical protein